MRFDVRPRIKRAFRLALRRTDLTDADVDEEIRFHVESRIEQLMDTGLTREQAMAEARLRFGLSWDDAVARVHQAGLEREERLDMTERLDAAWSDITYALRTLGRQPGFAIVVVLTFALGIGANATMFGVIDRLFLRPPPHVANAKALLQLARTIDFGGGEEHVMEAVPYPLYAVLRSDSTAFESVGAGSGVSTFTIGTGPTASQVDGMFAGSDYFRVLGTRPALGRFFGPADDDEGTPVDVAVISHGFWQRHYAGDRSVLGKRLRLGLRDFTIVGVAPEGFTGLDPRQMDVWIPLAHAAAFGMVAKGWTSHWGNNWLIVYLRLKPGVTSVAAVERARTAFANATADLSPSEKNKLGGSPRFMLHSVLPSDQMADSPEAKVARLLMAVSAVVLLIACANVAGLLLARGTVRRREIAVRLALGVSRSRLLRLLIAETVVLAIVGGVLAVVVAHVGLGLLHATLLSEYAWTESVFDVRMLAATFGLVLMTATLAGLAPAIRSSRPNVVASLKAGGRAGGVGLSRTRWALMVTQAALAVVLIVGAGLFVQSLRNASALRLGYERDRVLAATMDVVPLGYSIAERVALYEAMRDRVAAVPGVTTATMSSTHPLQGWGFGIRVRVPGRDSLPRSPLGGPYYNAVGADYFSALGIRIVEGRPIEAADGSSNARVAVLSETMARAFWPGERAVDRCVMIASESECTTVVGVAADAHESVNDRELRFLVYVPIGPTRFAGINTLLIRTSTTNATRMIEPIRRAMHGTRANLPYADVQAFDALLAPQLRPWKIGAVLFSLFGALALLIAAVGLYSAIAYAVTQRRHEFGVRAALGATAGDVVRLVTGQGLRAAVVGVAVGLLAAVWAGRFATELLFQTSARNPVVFGVVGVLVVLVALGASIIPALRASRTDPVVALRAD